MIEKFNKLDNNKKISIAIIVAIILMAIIIIGGYFSNKSTNYDYESIREDSSKTIVYTVDTKKEGMFYTNVPYVNVSGTTIKNINEDIASYIEDYSDEKSMIISYDYEVNGKVLSLVIKAADYDESNIPKAYFKTYNINLETKELLSDGDLLNIYSVTLDDVSTAIAKRFKYFYDDLIEEGYIEKDECDYECFLENRGVDDYMEGVAYYIEKGKLIAYKPFAFYSMLNEEEYFEEKDFKFTIAK